MAIYKLTNKINGMIYIGQTIVKNPFTRINRHFNQNKHNQFRLQNAIQKYGKENFSIFILDDTIDINLLNELEQYYIDFYNCLSPEGYNLKKGGENGGPCSEETKKKISIAKTGISNSKLLGRKFTQQHCDALSAVRKGKPQTEARKLANIKTTEKRCIPIIAINKQLNEYKIFNSIEECSRQLNLVASCVSRVLRNDQNRKQHKGWTFVYKENI